MKVLIITAKLAEPIVKRHLQGYRDVDVIVLDASVAALLTPKRIARELKECGLERYDMILVPGLVSGDVSSVEEEVGIPTYKGPRYAADLPWVLESLSKIELSKVTPASDILKAELQLKVEREISAIDEEYASSPLAEGRMYIGKLLVGRGLPSRIMAEIIDVPSLSDEQIQQRTKYYLGSGADIIDLGMRAGESKPEDAARVIEAVRSVQDCPISIDTLDVTEIEAAIDTGVDLIVSVDGSNLAQVAAIAGDSPVVVIPADHSEGRLPKDSMERVLFLETLLRKARGLGMRHLIADLILDPPCSPGVLTSLVAYRTFTDRNPDVPLIIGAGNITELMDADSIGVNALLACTSAELGGHIILTTENSDKTRGCVRELVVGAKMAALAMRRGSPPKDLGLSLLRYHEKRVLEESYKEDLERTARVVEVDESPGFRTDLKGSFRIMVDRKTSNIAAVHYGPGEPAGPDVIFKAKGAEALYRAIVKEGLISTLDHAAYLGFELGKAELALHTRRSYVQDAPLFD